jgi:hypothetical protein
MADGCGGPTPPLGGLVYSGKSHTETYKIQPSYRPGTCPALLDF